jgi:formylglycine-generating enzyme
VGEATTRTAPSRHAPAGMAWIPGGEFRMGSDEHYQEEAPAHTATVNGFWMDRYTVTNADFRRFVEATGYVTVAELPANPANYPGAKAEMLAPSASYSRSQRTASTCAITTTGGPTWRAPTGDTPRARAAG